MTSDLPPGWAWARVGDLGVEVRGQLTPQPGETYDLYSVPTFPTGRPERIAGAQIKSGKRGVKPDDVLLCKINPRINRVWIVGTTEGYLQIASTEYLVLRPHEPRMSSFMQQYLSSPRFRDWIKLSVEGATGSHTRAKSGPILQQPIPVAPLAEQRRIVAAIKEHFSHLDAAATALSAAQTRLYALQRSAATRLFDRPDWTWTVLGEVAALKGGITKDSKREADPRYVEYPYLRVANVQRGFLDLSEVTTIRADRNKAEKLVLQPGDILFTEGGDRDKLGRGWVWDGQIANCIHQNHVFRARLTNGDFDPRFISMHANTWGQQWFETHGKQTTNLASINLTTLKSFPVPAPPLDEQRAVVYALQSIMRSQDRLQADLNRAERCSKTLRRAVLSSAFSGQLVAQDPNDEPASVLLERIAASGSTKPNRRASARQLS